jgi:hypothetical protein
MMRLMISKDSSGSCERKTFSSREVLLGFSLRSNLNASLQFRSAVMEAKNDLAQFSSLND